MSQNGRKSKIDRLHFQTAANRDSVEPDSCAPIMCKPLRGATPMPNVVSSQSSAHRLVLQVGPRSKQTPCSVLIDKNFWNIGKDVNTYTSSFFVFARTWSTSSNVSGSFSWLQSGSSRTNAPARNDAVPNTAIGTLW